MPKVLVIPDVHLKPWMFDRASRLMGRADVAVVLGDQAFVIYDTATGSHEEARP